MKQLYVERETIISFLHRLGTRFEKSGRLYLVGSTGQVVEGWRRWTEQIEFTADLATQHRAAFEEIVNELLGELKVQVVQEAPGDVIPLPAGYAQRSRPLNHFPAGNLSLYHFDPYSISFRLITRGDEPDYETVLAFLEHGWITEEIMKSMLVDLLPQFTNESIAQDPAEFRRKFRGLQQMWHASG